MPVLAHPDPEFSNSASTVTLKTECDDTFESMMFRYPARETFPAEHNYRETIPYRLSRNIAAAYAMTSNPHSSLSVVQHVASKGSALDESKLHPRYLDSVMAGSRQQLFQSEEMGLSFEASAEESVYPIRQSIEKDHELPFGDTSTPANEPWTWTGYVKHTESSERSSLRREAERLRGTRDRHVVRVERNARVRVEES